MKVKLPKETQPDVYNRLVEAIAESDSIAMVGAGCSQRVGYPGWNGLLWMLVEKAVEKEPSAELELNELLESDGFVCANRVKGILSAEEFYSQ